jgi:hypothetical protein
MNGILREMVHDIDRPGFISQKDFAALIGNKYPYGYDLVWPLLTYDLFQKYVARKHCPESAARVWHPEDGVFPPPSGTGASAGPGAAPAH